MDLTALQYLKTFEPHVIDLLLGDPVTALQADTERAHEIARSLKLNVDDGGRYPEAIWLLVYR